MSQEFHEVSDCSVVDAHGNVLGVMRDHWVAHELVEMAERDELWVNPEIAAEERKEIKKEHSEIVDTLQKQIKEQAMKIEELSKELDRVTDYTDQIEYLEAQLAKNPGSRRRKFCDLEARA